MEEGFLDINTFREITGLDLEDELQIRMFNRANARASRLLSQYLGWRPDYRAVFEEAAIVRNEGTCPTEQQLEDWKNDPVKNNFFIDADDEEGQIKLFPYYPEDANYFIDPCTAVYAVKIVKVLSADDQEFITVKKLAPEDWNQKPNQGFRINRNSIIQWLEICNAPNMLPCKCEENKSCYMLAVDADWVRVLPEDLLYLLTDLCLFYMQHQPTLSTGSVYAISSESVDGHSVSYDTKTVNAATKNTEDEVLEPYLNMIKMYIGPYSTLYVNKTRVL